MWPTGRRSVHAGCMWKRLSPFPIWDECKFKDIQYTPLQVLDNEDDWPPTRLSRAEQQRLAGLDMQVRRVDNSLVSQAPRQAAGESSQTAARHSTSREQFARTESSATVARGSTTALKKAPQLAQANFPATTPSSKRPL